MRGKRDHVELEVVLVEIAPHLEAAPHVQPAQVIHVVHAEGPARRPGEERRRRVLADPVVGDRMPAVDHLAVGCVEHFERGHDLPRGHRLDLHGAAGQFVDALREDTQMVLQRDARRPGRLHLDGLGRRRLRLRAGGERRGDDSGNDRARAHGTPPRLIAPQATLGLRAMSMRPSRAARASRSRRRDLSRPRRSPAS